MMSRLSLFPLTTKVNDQGHLEIGGCDAVQLAAEFGTPLYLFDEFSIDKPTVEDGIITWCPMHYERRRVKAAAYVRSDGELVTGKCHADIIKASPYGTCKAGSTSGFIDNHDQFISREVAWKLALEARQIKIEKIRKRGEYLLSEEIWSDVDNGDWTYDEEKGYILKKDRE